MNIGRAATQAPAIIGAKYVVFAKRKAAKPT